MVDAASTTATVPLYEECFRCTSIVHGSVRLSAVRRAGPPARGSAGASAAYSPRRPRRSVRRRSAPGSTPSRSCAVIIPYSTVNAFARFEALNSTGSVTTWNSNTAENSTAPTRTRFVEARNRPMAMAP